jgi:hypothetical protein
MEGVLGKDYWGITGDALKETKRGLLVSFS